MMIIVFAYNRPDALLNLLHELKGRNVTVIDDGSDYDPKQHKKLCNYIRTEHRGKRYFYKQWQFAFDLAKNSDETKFLFLPDDCYNINFDVIDSIDEREPFLLHLFNFGREQSWVMYLPKRMTFNGVEVDKVEYVDCMYLTNYSTLDLIDWTTPEVSQSWFIRGDISSGVGAMQSKHFHAVGIPMYRPVTPLASTGKYDSVMHYEHRKLTPLIC
jgi:hypothetical protein